MRTLKEAEIGETVKVVKLHGEIPIKKHIMDMGITKGCTVFIRKVAPLGDPIEVTVRGYELSLRKSEAELVEIEEKAEPAEAEDVATPVENDEAAQPAEDAEAVE